jgi:hypothetical protein
MTRPRLDIAQRGSCLGRIETVPRPRQSCSSRLELLDSPDLANNIWSLAEKAKGMGLKGYVGEIF